MTFFNKKEDVISIELTPHGRKLLSKGKLKPAYYAFFDDDILYDSQRGGFTETNSETKARIISETPSMRPQTNYKGVESKIENMRSHETENNLLTPIGTNKIEEAKTAGWSISFLHNTASSMTSFFSDANSQTLQIPQIESTIEYKMTIPRGETRLTPADLLQSQDFSKSNDRINLKTQQVLINILEKNGFNFNESLEMEVFLYEQDQQSYKKLYFREQESLIINNMYVDTTNDMSALFKTEDVPNDPGMVEYWLRMNFDSEISDFDKCSGLQKLNSRDIHLDIEVKCPDLDTPIGDIYSNNITEIEDCEE